MCIAAASTWSMPIAARSEAARIARTQPPPGLPAHGYGAALRPCRLRRAGRLSAPRRRSRRTRSAIPCSTAPPCWSSRACCSGAEILDIYNETEATLTRIAEQAIKRPKLTTSAEVMASIVPPKRDAALGNTPSPEERAGAVRPRCRHDRQAAAYGAAAQLGARRPDARAITEIIVAGEDVGPKGGVYNCHRQAARALRLGARDQHPARRADASSASASAPRITACCRSPRSSSSPTSTMPRTRSAARRRRSASSRTANTPTRWSSGSPGSATRRASAGISTTTTASPSSATFPG